MASLRALVQRLPGSWKIANGHGFALGAITAADLPLCTASRDNEHRSIPGGAGVADRIVVCEKDAADAYAWEDKGAAVLDLFLTSAEADSLFLTPAEGDALFLTPAEGNTAYQPLDADLTTIAANITAAGHAILDDANAAAQRVTLGITEPGLVLIGAPITFAAVSTVSLNGVFTSEFENYLVLVRLTDMTAMAHLLMRLRVAGVDASGATYYWSVIAITSAAATPVGAAGNADTSWNISYEAATVQDDVAVDVIVRGPQATGKTLFRGGNEHSRTTPASVMNVNGGLYNATTSYDGFSLITGSGNMTGEVSVYGYGE